MPPWRALRLCGGQHHTEERANKRTTTVVLKKVIMVLSASGRRVHHDIETGVESDSGERFSRHDA